MKRIACLRSCLPTSVLKRFDGVVYISSYFFTRREVTVPGNIDRRRQISSRQKGQTKNAARDSLHCGHGFVSLFADMTYEGGTASLVRSEGLGATRRRWESCRIRRMIAAGLRVLSGRTPDRHAAYDADNTGVFLNLVVVPGWRCGKLETSGAGRRR